ncbi:hypothetical protein [Sphingosinicella sp. BN140058]|uniref:hypothetical protein n=1 Tax=Sphingosinicella sp. BN140058 TaxID=1892855 RepID=UPI001010E67D|nr:hypothetical protein [Sphingosinicella sp. BN140058]QAY78141.1 hypothetical protein ETR14_17615 [Sphingosinicella sp. BN140058]
MSMMSMIGTGRCDALVDALKAEFGGMLAERILEAEALDFLWEARVRERYLGQHEAAFLDDVESFDEVSRIVILSLVDGCWHVGLCQVDGNGHASELLWKRRFESLKEAEIAYHSVH